MEELEYDLKIHPLYSAGLEMECNGVGNGFRAHIRALYTNEAQFKCHSVLKHCCCYVHPFTATVHLLLNGLLWQDRVKCHKA